MPPDELEVLAAEIAKQLLELRTGVKELKQAAPTFVTKGQLAAVLGALGTLVLGALNL